MKKILAIVLLGVAVTAAQAQSEFQNPPAQIQLQNATSPASEGAARPSQRENGKTIEERAQEQVARLTKRLSLTPDQQKKAYDITFAAMKEGQEAKKALEGDRAAMREKRKSMMEATEVQIKALLTADQIKKFDQMKAERQARMQERMQNRQNGGGGSQDMGGY